MLKDLIKVQDRVKYILQNHPECRDNDKLLWLAYNCLFNGLKEKFANTWEYNGFKMWLLQEDVPVFESLSRARRKVQVENPSLEGKKKERLQEAEAVKDYINDGL